MITTPLITKIKTNGGTLYTFTSTSKDLTKVATNNTKYKFKFSHFACLNLPYIMSGVPTLSEHINDNNNVNVEQTKKNEKYQFFKSIQTEIVSHTVFTISIELTDENDFDYVKTCSIKFISPINDEISSFEKIDGKYFKCQFDNSKFNSGNEIKFRIIMGMDDSYIGEKHELTTGDITYDPDVIGNKSDKGLYLEQFEDYSYKNNDYNIAVAEHFQNYILNFESVLLNTDYDDNVLNTPAERIFFNWLRKVGGIKFKSGKNKTFVEDVENYYKDANEYLDRTVQYLGNIDILNQVDVNGDTFGEVYLYIPSDVGATPNVYFRTLTDSPTKNTNYKNDLYRWSSEIICGRDNFSKEDRPIDGIGLDAIYDGDIGSNYYTGDDGYYIDFTPSTYDVVSGNIDDINKKSYINFEFNCVLLYYDITNTQTNETSTNLYGVLFIDNFVRDDRETSNDSIRKLAYIDPIPKFRSSELDDGNSFALKVDLKIDTAPTTTMYRTNVESDIYYDPNDTKSFQLYQSALEQLHKCTDIFYSQQREIYELQDRIEELESIIVNLRSANDAFEKIDEISSRLDDSKLNQLDNYIDKINENSEYIEGLQNGTTSITFDLSGLNFGEGFTRIDENGKVYIKNNTQSYNYRGKISFNKTPQKEENESDVDYLTRINKFSYYVSDDNRINISLKSNTNLFLFGEVENGDYDVTTDELIIDIDASRNDFSESGVSMKWENGQSIKFVITDDFKFNKTNYYGIKFITSTSNEEITIASISKDELQKMSDKSEIELVCINNDVNMDNETGNDYDMQFIKIIR